MRFYIFTLFLVALGFSPATAFAGQINFEETSPYIQVSASDGLQLLTGPQLETLFGDLENVEYPTDQSSYTPDDWQFTFKADNSWESNNSNAAFDDTWGQWRVEGDTVCVTNKNVQSYSNPYEGCFQVYANWSTGMITGDFPGLGKKQHALKKAAFGDLERLRSQPETSARTAPRAKSESKHDQKLEMQRLALERERLEIRKSTDEIQRLKLKLELERLHQKRTLAPKPKPAKQIDTTPPTINTRQALVTRTSRATVTGAVTDNAALVRVEFNGQKIQTTDGRFSIQAPVNLGLNTIRIAAYDAAGNRAERIVTVTRNRNIPDIKYGDYYALVIGINDYKSLPKLNTAVTDSKTVAKMLEELYGYKVTLLTNATRDDIIDAFDDLREKLSEGDNLLIYYAGHGWLDPQTGSGYWLPVNAKPDRRSRWFSNATLTEALQGLLAKHVMVVADSCYSGTLTRSAKITERNPSYIQRIAEKRARVVLSSGGLEPVADSGGGAHSIFAAQFLKALRSNEGILDGTQIFEQVRKSVVINADQTPEYSDIRRAGHEGGDFLFVRKN
jgi:hypothetical protein